MNNLDIIASVIVLLGEVSVRGEADCRRMAEVYTRLGAVMAALKAEAAEAARPAEGGGEPCPE